MGRRLAIVKIESFIKKVNSSAAEAINNGSKNDRIIDIKVCVGMWKGSEFKDDDDDDGFGGLRGIL